MKRHTGLLIGIALFWISVPAVAAQGGRVSVPLILRGGSGTQPSPTVAPPTATRFASPSKTPSAIASPTVAANPTPTATATATPTATPSATATQPSPGPTTTALATPTPLLDQLLRNEDFEEGPIYWERASNGYNVQLIKEDVGQFYTWGVELGGRFGAQDAVGQIAYIPDDTLSAWVSYDIKMKTLESTLTTKSVFVAALTDVAGNPLEILGYYDNTMTPYLWSREYSDDISAYRGRSVGVALSAITEGLTTFYIDDVYLMVERPAH